MYRLADILGERGHNVTILNYKLTEEAAKPRLKYCNEVIFDARSDFFKKIFDLKTEEFLQDVAWNSTNSNLDYFRKLYKFLCLGAIANIFFLHNKTMLDEFLEMEKFDLAIIYQFDTASFALSRTLGIDKVIWVSTSYFLDPMPWTSGISTPASHVPSGSHPVTDHMIFIERVWNLLLRIFFELGHYFLNIRYYNMVNSYFYRPDIPDLSDLLSSVDLYMLNSNAFLEYPRPIANNVIDISGLAYMDEPSGDIIKKWDYIMRQTKSQIGTIIFSLGSVIDSSLMSSFLKSNFLDSFKALKSHTFIMRLDGEKVNGSTYPNVIFQDWIPQRYLIRRFKVDVLITHGGYNSISEAAYFGLPTIVIPFCGDQFGNVKRQEKLQTGISLEKESLTKGNILSALDRVLADDK
uniref:UDP-glucuronosyltransferase n=1 Tax=Romanomermis culicivorax TaxID=13658 RepID=A0A915IY64_ROMCU